MNSHFTHDLPRRQFLQSSLTAAIGWPLFLPRTGSNASRPPLLHPRLRELLPWQGRFVFDPYLSTFTEFALLRSELGEPDGVFHVDIRVQVAGGDYVLELSILTDPAASDHVVARMAETGIKSLTERFEITEIVDDIEAYMDDTFGEVRLSTAGEVFVAAQAIFDALGRGPRDGLVKPVARLNPECMAVAEQIRELNPRWLAITSNPFGHLEIGINVACLSVDWRAASDSLLIDTYVQPPWSTGGHESEIDIRERLKVVHEAMASRLSNTITDSQSPTVSAILKPAARLPELCVEIAQIVRTLGFDESADHTSY
jgi:hypothetical protein